MAWLLLYLFLLIVFFIVSIILKLFKTKIITQSRIIIILKVIFIIPLIFFYSTNNLINLFPDIKKIVAKPKKYQHIQIINDTKATQSFIVLKKEYLKNKWKFNFNLSSHINYSKIISVNPKDKIDLLFSVDTNEFNRIAICKISHSQNYPTHSIILQVPDNKYILFASEFIYNSKNKIIINDSLDDLTWFIFNFSFFLLTIFVLVHLPIHGKIKYFYYALLIIVGLGIGLIIYFDTLYLLKIYKFI